MCMDHVSSGFRIGVILRLQALGSESNGLSLNLAGNNKTNIKKFCWTGIDIVCLLAWLLISALYLQASMLCVLGTSPSEGLQLTQIRQCWRVALLLKGYSGNEWINPDAM